MKNKYVKIFLSFILISLLFGFVFLIFSDEEKENDASNEAKDEKTEFSFETSPGFYENDLDIRINYPKNAKVYYSINKQKPEDCDNKECLEYAKTGIRVLSRDTMTVRTITAQYKDENGWSDEIVGTFVVGKNVSERFSTMSVFITTDPDNLWGYESGILVEGKLRDDWRAANPREKVIPISPAGYMQRGKESEKKVNIEFFDVGGQRVINQNVGIRVSGAYTRAYILKSLKVFARKEYDPVQYRFDYKFFGNQYSQSGGGKLIDSYKKILLRSSGSDLGYGQIRDELHQTLAQKAGIFGAQSVIPVSVFLNGSYYGQMWAHDVICDEYFEDHLGDFEGKFEVVSGPERSKPDERYEIDNIEEVRYAYDDWNEMYNTYSVADLKDEKIYKEFCSKVDVENYLFYYAMNIYVNNNDWPYNNHKAYRYYAADGEEYRKNTFFDGKWRFLPHDMDGYWAPDLNILHNYVLDPKQERFSPLFNALMQRDDCVEMFVRYLYELRNGAFSPDCYKSTLKEMNEERYSELKHYFSDSTYVKGSLAQVNDCIKKYNYYADKRPETLKTDLKIQFGLSGKTFNVSVKKIRNCYVVAGEKWEINEDFVGEYPIEYPTVFTAFPKVGYEFDHWLVNGKKVRGTEELILTAENAENGNISVVPVMKEKEDKKLIISEYHNADKGDYLVIANPYPCELSTNGYSLSDSEKKPNKYILPSITVKPGGHIKVYCENYNGKEKMHQMCVPFNIKEGETVYFSYEKETVQTVYIEKYSKDGYGKLDYQYNKFFEVS